METHTNDLGQPIGHPLPAWTPASPPSDGALVGRSCRLEPLDPERHSRPLFEANARDVAGAQWTYLPYGPFPDLASYTAWTEDCRSRPDPFFYAIIDARSGAPLGVASYLRIEPGHGTIEVGHINYSPALQRTAAATEAMYLMMRNAFELGYRRYEWKCDALNAGSRSAAERLGFTFEGVFRQATVYKGRNRDTAWYAVIDRDWPAIGNGYQRWLAASNFDADGRQLRRLGDLIGEARQAT